MSVSANNIKKAWTLIQEARDQQDKLCEEGEFEYTCASPGMEDAERFCVLSEEVGEVARNILVVEGLVKDGVIPNGLTVQEMHLRMLSELQELRKELAQVAAVAEAWIENLNERIETHVHSWGLQDLA